MRYRCPRCGKMIHWEGNPYRPFCSQRCKLIDFGMWIDEGYRITGETSNFKKKGEGG
jgi:hypothetical protein